MLRDNADILQRLADEAATLSAEDAAAAGSDERLQAAVTEATATLTASEAALATADRRACRGGSRPQPVRALAARRRRPPRPAGAADRRRRARGRRDRAAASQASPIPRKSGRWPRMRQPLVTAVRAGGTCRRKGRRGAAPGRGGAAHAAAGGEGRAGADRDRGAHAGEDPQCGDRRPVPGGAGADQGRARLRDRAWRGAWRRSRRSARSRRAGPLGRQRAAAGRSGSAARGPAAGQRRRRRRRSSPAGWRRSASSWRPTASGCPKCWRPASAWSAATARCGAGTGWWRGPTPRPPPRSAWRRRTASPNSTPKPLPPPRKLRAAEQALADAERALREGTEAERAARQGWRDAQHQLDAARDALQKAEKAAGELTARRAALAESLSRLNEAHAEASGAVTEAERGTRRGARPVGAAGLVRSSCGRRAARPRDAGRRARPP